MDKDTIRELNERVQGALLKAKTGEAQDVGIASAQLSMLSEIAAQLSEVNEYLKCIAHPLIEVVKEEAKPEIVNFSYGKIQVMDTYATFRDQLAMAALTAIIGRGDLDTEMNVSPYCQDAYTIADAMLEERKK